MTTPKEKKRKKLSVLKTFTSKLPVGETEFAPIAANVTRFCMFTEFTTEKSNYRSIKRGK